jgi:hypothetical protein
MVELRPLIIVTGTVHVEGGDVIAVRGTRHEKARATTRIVLDRQVSSDRRAANVIATDYMRKLRAVRILRTPFGVLVDPKRLDEVKQLIVDVGKRIGEYSAAGKRACVLSNCVVWEHLRGNRLTAVSAWIETKLSRGDEPVKTALPQLVVTAVVAA